MKQNNQKGFTLIELLVVIAIIGLLASVILLALNSARAKSRDAKRVADVRQLSNALELFYNDAGGYPASLASLITSNFIGIIPAAPLPIDGDCATDALASNDLIYTAEGVPAANLYPDYTLSFCLGAPTGGYTAGGHFASPIGIQ